MSEDPVIAALDKVDTWITGYEQFVNIIVTNVKQAVRDDCTRIREDVSLSVSVIELRLDKAALTLVYDAEYHLVRAYFHASPSLLSFLLALYAVVQVVVSVIKFINETLLIITGESLAHHINMLIDGFEDFWKNLMNKISYVSGMLGWGVDGLGHLMNAYNTGADTWGILTGRDRLAVKAEKARRMEKFLYDVGSRLGKWQANPGEMIDYMVEMGNTTTYWASSEILKETFSRINGVEERAYVVSKYLGDTIANLASLQNDMPAFIAKHIPQVIWDTFVWIDKVMSEYIFPSLRIFEDRLNELDAVLESHRKKADELSDKIAHPGDMLSEIDKLPGYARTDQLVKIDSVTSALLRERNEADFAAMQAGLRESAAIAAALGQPPAPLEFMELELPGRSPGIEAEPCETWFVGDF